MDKSELGKTVRDIKNNINKDIKFKAIIIEKKDFCEPESEYYDVFESLHDKYPNISLDELKNSPGFYLENKHEAYLIADNISDIHGFHRHYT